MRHDPNKMGFELQEHERELLGEPKFAEFVPEVGAPYLLQRIDFLLMALTAQNMELTAEGNERERINSLLQLKLIESKTNTLTTMIECLSKRLTAEAVVYLLNESV